MVTLHAYMHIVYCMGLLCTSSVARLNHSPIGSDEESEEQGEDQSGGEKVDQNHNATCNYSFVCKARWFICLISFPWPSA